MEKPFVESSWLDPLYPIRCDGNLPPAKVKTMLTRKVAIYIPSTVDANVAASSELVAKWSKQAKILLSNLFGGFTAYHAQGGWYSAEKGLIEEPVLVVNAFTDDNGLNESNLNQIRFLARLIAIDMQQEAVSVEHDGKLEFIQETTMIHLEQQFKLAA